MDRDTKQRIDFTYFKRCTDAGPLTRMQFDRDMSETSSRNSSSCTESAMLIQKQQQQQQLDKFHCEKCNNGGNNRFCKQEIEDHRQMPSSKYSQCQVYSHQRPQEVGIMGGVIPNKQRNVHINNQLLNSNPKNTQMYNHGACQCVLEALGGQSHAANNAHENALDYGSQERNTNYSQQELSRVHSDSTYCCQQSLQSHGLQSQPCLLYCMHEKNSEPCIEISTGIRCLGGDMGQLNMQKNSFVIEAKNPSNNDWSQDDAKMKMKSDNALDTDNSELKLIYKSYVPISKAQKGDLRYSDEETQSNLSLIDMNPKQNIKLAGMKIFASIMLHSWRRRQEDVRRLMQRVEDLKLGSQRVRSQAHVYNALFRFEKKRNDELSNKLKTSAADMTKARISCEDLTTTMYGLKADNDILRRELEKKTEDLEAIHVLLAQTKADLFRSMAEQHSLQTELSKEEHNNQILENQKDKLVSEIYILNDTNRILEEKFYEQLRQKDNDLHAALEKIKLLELKIEELGVESWKWSETAQHAQRLQKEVEELKEIIRKHHICNGEGAPQINLQFLIRKTIFIQKCLLHLAHVFVYHLLPAVPQPNSMKIQLRYLES